jgi:hypothetical protein
MEIKDIAELPERFSKHLVGTFIFVGVALVIISVLDVHDFKLRPSAVPVPLILGLFFLGVGLLLHFFDPSTREITRYFKELSPPNLLFLAVAKSRGYPWMHGSEVARLNPDWRHGEEEWKKRSEKMEKLGLLNNYLDEVERTHLGTAVVYLALKEAAFHDVAKLVASDPALANEWGLASVVARV